MFVGGSGSRGAWHPIPGIALPPHISTILINGSGVLTKWKWPAIDEVHDFNGVLAHSANLSPRGLEWTGKPVAVTGTGSISIQMVPKIAETAAHLTVFMLNCTYISPQMISGISNKEAVRSSWEGCACAVCEAWGYRVGH
ncbi:hypothetical protein M011DRAFT_475070 [Sporormia fimetaria CBS 119925]|uniref:Uncharacterized protein n=1 Tax=Sporormia fimetaria CBS 119925 TaxID=1340428 RepID=A0A6A6VGM3_9PLEO|nr:hypothetical protein M011DRAFT_475070 [Sporormia fimetaria CBS 119925]